MSGAQGLFLFCCCLFLLQVFLAVENLDRRKEMKRLSEADRDNIRALQKQHEADLLLAELTGPGGREVYLWWLANRESGEADWPPLRPLPAPSPSGGSTKEETT